jgi:uncharacterized membrane protein
VAEALSRLERNVLKTKGVTDAQLEAMAAAGIASRADFATVADAATLSALVPSLTPAVAEAVMAWGLGRPAPAAALASASAVPSGSVSRIVLDTPEAVVCGHCKAKQPAGATSESLCVSCGRHVDSPPAAPLAAAGPARPLT